MNFAAARLPWWYVLPCLALAFACLGRWGPDEHFSILEFLGYKLGTTPWEFLHFPNSLSDLPWEFPEKIRPFTEVFVFFCIAKIFSPLTTNPVVLEGLYRLLAVAISLFAVHKMLNYGTGTPEKNRIALWSVYVCGFLPYLYTRIMSEMMGATTLTIGVLLFLSRRELKYLLLSGFMIGMSFWLRYHIGFMIAGFGLWLLIIERASFRVIAALTLGFIVACAINIVLDRWGYGVWTFSPWNYFNTGIIQDRAARYGVSPVWYYPILIWREMGPGVLLAFIVACLHWILFPRSALTWMGFVFFLGHTIVPRKEARFLIPLFFLTPLYLAGLWGRLSENRKMILTKYAKLAGSAGLIYAALWGLNQGVTRNEMRFYYRYYSSPIAKETLYAVDQGPFNWGGYYYRPLGYREVIVHSHAEFMAKLDGNTKYLFNTTFDFPPMLQNYCHLALQTIPMWLDKINVNHWVDRTAFWQIYACRRPLVAGAPQADSKK